MLGQRARFERYAAEMLYVMATGRQIDPDKATRFVDLMEKVYQNPFEKKPEQPQTTEEIKQYILRRLEE